MDKQAREARELMKTLPFKERAKNFWFYNKWYVFGGLMAFILLSVTLYECMTQVQYDLDVFYVTESPVKPEVETALEEYLSQYVDDVNNDGVKNVAVNVLTAPLDNVDPQMAMAAQTKLMAELSGGESMAYLTDKAYAEVIAQGFPNTMEESCDITLIPGLKEKVGFYEKDLMFTPKLLFDREKEDEEKVVKHATAMKILEVLKTDATMEKTEQAEKAPEAQTEQTQPSPQAEQTQKTE
ncbi:MAG: hypothetical protein RSC29_06075 [Oscillospiraceae bacterium]